MKFIFIFPLCFPLVGFCRCYRLPQVRSLSRTVPLHQGVHGPPWKLGKLNHIAIAVPDMEKATALYRDVLGATVSEKVPLPEHGVYTVFVELGSTKLELLHPLGEKSPIAGFLQKNKSGGMHHICIEVRKQRYFPEKNSLNWYKTTFNLHPQRPDMWVGICLCLLEK